jgi:hypothetical protein
VRVWAIPSTVIDQSVTGSSGHNREPIMILRHWVNQCGGPTVASVAPFHGLVLGCRDGWGAVQVGCGSVSALFKQICRSLTPGQVWGCGWCGGLDLGL